jgi:hypothetical protein
MGCRSFAIMIVAAGLAGLATPSAAQQQTCHGYGTQYGDFRLCVSSVLASQGSNRYGPEHLNGTTDGAWCEGAPGPGVGQTVTFHQKPDNVVGSVMITNGYVKTEKAWGDNGRVKRARIETSGGYRKEVTLKDEPLAQEIKFSPSRVSWIRLTILDVYPGARHQDTCITMFSPAIEEFAVGN